MDFSLAQRKGHCIAYTNAVVETLDQYTWSQLGSDLQEQQHKLFVREAEMLEVGCSIHFDRSLRRLRNNGAVVNPDHQSAFDKCIQTMRSKNSTIQEFDNANSELLRQFPRLKNWSTWWTQHPSIASMIFPAKSRVSSELRSELPSTSNPVEHQHSLLNHASGTHHDLLPGASMLQKHVLELEAQHRAVESGVYDAVGVQPSTRSFKKKVFDNDGRAPDTIETLKAPVIEPLADLGLMSYAWLSPNSCFWDTGFELWYRAVRRWDEGALDTLRMGLPAESFMSGLLCHFFRRRREEQRWGDVAAPESIRKMAHELQLGQRIGKQYIFDKWELYPHGAHGNASHWLQHAVQVSLTCFHIVECIFNNISYRMVLSQIASGVHLEFAISFHPSVLRVTFHPVTTHRMRTLLLICDFRMWRPSQRSMARTQQSRPSITSTTTCLLTVQTGGGLFIFIPRSPLALIRGALTVLG